MKTSMTALASVAAILPAATANFDLYFTTVGGVGGSDRAWTLYNDPPECSEAEGAYTWSNLNDVSGSKRGIRCEGDGCAKSGSNGEITELEMNFDDEAHWTVYKHRGYEMFDLDGNAHGRCMMYPHEDFHCNVGPIGIIDGFRRMRCLSDWYADDINP